MKNNRIYSNAYKGHNGLYTGTSGGGGGAPPPPPPGCVAEQGLKLTATNGTSGTYQLSLIHI